MNSVPPALTLVSQPTRPATSRSDAVRDGLVAHHASLLRAARRRTGDATEAEDLVQETYVRALRFAHLFRPGTNLFAWLHTILRNTHLSHVQARSIRPRTLHPEVSAGVFEAVRDGRTPHTQVAAGNFIARRDQFDGRLHDAICALPTIYREPLLLFALDRYSYREIAEVLDIPVGTVMSRLHRARNAVRAKLATARGVDRPNAA